MPIVKSAIELIGNTPLLEISHLDTGPCRLFLKLELMNPGGSIKDRIALYMIEQAEKNGQIKPGGIIVEGTAGNTGLGLALLAKLKGYHCIIVMPDKMSREKIMHLRAMGAEVIMTRSDVQKGHPEYYTDLAQSIADKTENAFFINQFENENNALTHELFTGPEMWQTLQEEGLTLDAFVAGMGSSGTMTGVGRYLKKVNPAVELILADPKGSILADYVNSRKNVKASSWLVEGIGEDFIPAISEVDKVTKAYSVSDKESFLAARELLQKEGIFAGPSTGTLLHAALCYAREQTQAKNIVTLACDTGNKYLSKLYNDVWMVDQNFLEPQTHQDLRDVVSYPHDRATTIVIRPQEPLSTAFKRLIINFISQIPVIDEDKPNKVLGLVSELDILKALREDQNCFDAPVSEHMNRDFIRMQHTDSFDTLVEALNKSNAVLIFVEKAFFGVVTHTDVINYLKRTRLNHE